MKAESLLYCCTNDGKDVTTTVLPRKSKLKIERPEMHFKMHKVDLTIPPLILAPQDDQNNE